MNFKDRCEFLKRQLESANRDENENSIVRWFVAFIMLTSVLVFTTLKYFKIINWSWWIIFAPIWAPYALLIVLTILILIIPFSEEDVN